MGAGIYLGIMRPSHRLAAAGSTPPPFLGDIMSWAKGDVGVRTAGFYDSLAENGPMGGQFAFEGSKPADTVQFSDLKHVPSFTFGQRFRSTLAASSWNFLHDGSQPYTISGRFYAKTVGTGGRLVGTNNGTTLIGMRIIAASTGVSVILHNGTAQTILAHPTPIVAGTWYTFICTYTPGGNVTLQVNDAAPVSTAYTPGVGTATSTMYLGNQAAGSAPLNGFLAEYAVHDVVLSPQRITTLKQYYASRWSSVPGIVAYLDADNGLTIASGLVSAWADRAVGNGLSDAGSTARRPSIVSPWRNGQNALRFDGSDVLSRATLLHGTLAQPSAIYHVGEYPNPGAAGERISSHIGASRSDEFTAAGVVNLTMYSGASLAATISPPAPGLAFASFAHYGGASSVIGTYISNGNFHSNSGNAGTLGRDGLAVGAFSLSSNFWTGAIALVMLVDHVPSTAGHTEIINANRARYNI